MCTLNVLVSTGFGPLIEIDGSVVRVELKIE